MKLKIEKEEFINKTFRLDVKLVNQMNEVCEKKGISLNKLVDVCVRYALENLEDDNKDE
jgi:predicted HicB family RNase H-like nuclease